MSKEYKNPLQGGENKNPLQGGYDPKFSGVNNSPEEVRGLTPNELSEWLDKRKAAKAEAQPEKPKSKPAKN